MKALYITTFNKKLYDQSGKALINSFFEHKVEGDLLVCYEDMEFQSEQCLSYNMRDDKYMCNWLETNKERIPEFYGGQAGQDHPITKQYESKQGQYWANHRASRYFRKIVALNYALQHYSENYDVFFVVDSDCIFKKGININFASELFANNSSMIYFWSPYRLRIDRGPETGFTGFLKERNGFDFAKKICDCYETQDFLRFTYWDDGYVIGRLILENREKFVLHDLVGTTQSKTTRVMDIKDQILFDYVHHFKNRHQTS